MSSFSGNRSRLRYHLSRAVFFFFFACCFRSLRKKENANSRRRGPAKKKEQETEECFSSHDVFRLPAIMQVERANMFVASAPLPYLRESGVTTADMEWGDGSEDVRLVAKMVTVAAGTAEWSADATTSPSFLRIRRSFRMG